MDHPDRSGQRRLIDGGLCQPYSVGALSDTKQATGTIVGLDIGGTKCAAVIARDDGSPRELVRIATANPRETLDALFDAIEATAPHDPVFGVSCGGPLDEKAGLILSPPNLPSWDGIAIVDELTARLGGRAFLMNDANAGALAEWRYGAAQGLRNVIFLTFGTGNGAGLILDGRLYEGTSGSAGEVGHVRIAEKGPVGYGKAGSFEGLASGGGIARLATERYGHPMAARGVAEAAERGDLIAITLLADVGRSLGRGLAILIDLLNPEMIVLGSLYVRCQRFFESSMREALEAEALPQPLRDCSIVPAALGEEIGDYAAIAVARYGMEHA
jgi:glucokinase